MTTDAKKIQDIFEIMDTLERAFDEVEVFPEFDEFKEVVRQAVARRLLERLHAASAPFPSKKRQKREQVEVRDERE